MNHPCSKLKHELFKKKFIVTLITPIIRGWEQRQSEKRDKNNFKYPDLIYGAKLMSMSIKQKYCEIFVAKR